VWGLRFGFGIWGFVPWLLDSGYRRSVYDLRLWLEGSEFGM
jgi:hypothetical protein